VQDRSISENEEQKRQSIEHARYTVSGRVSPRESELRDTIDRLMAENNTLRAQLAEPRTGEIADCRSVEKELKKFKTISDTANVGNAISDYRGRFVYVNDAFARMHGYEVSEVLGKHFSFFHTSEQMEYFERTEEMFNRQGGLTNVKMWHVKKDGTVFPTLMNATIIEEEDRKDLFVSTTAIDISRLHDMQMELEGKNRNLAEVNNALSVLIRKVEQERRELEEKMTRNLRTVVKPFLAKLKRSGLTASQKACVDTLETNLNNILTPFSEKLAWIPTLVF